MQLAFSCPRCTQPVRNEVTDATQLLACSGCGWSRSLPPGDVEEGRPKRCLACRCHDLWRQKDFPQHVGLLMVGLAAVLSTIAWAYVRPFLAIGILMGFALIDLLLYALMQDVLVCYRCGARHRHAHPDEGHPRFDLEIAERYRQEAKRLQQKVRG